MRNKDNHQANSNKGMNTDITKDNTICITRRQLGSPSRSYFHITGDAIRFSVGCILLLNRAYATHRTDSSKAEFDRTEKHGLPRNQYVQLIVNEKEMQMYVRISDVDARDAIRWTNGSGLPAKISSTLFCTNIYRKTGLDTHLEYKVPATIIQTGDEPVLCFDLQEYEALIPLNGKAVTA